MIPRSALLLDEHVLMSLVWTYTAAGGDRLHSRAVDFTQVEEYYKGAPGAYTAFVDTDFLSAPELAAARDRIEWQRSPCQMGPRLAARLLWRSGSAFGQPA